LTVGAGVGAPLGLLALGLGTWALLERRKRKRSVSGMAYTGMHGDLQPPPVGMFGKRAEKAELVSVHQLLLAFFKPLRKRPCNRVVIMPLFD
jgi:hypothetical protein